MLLFALFNPTQHDKTVDTRMPPHDLADRPAASTPPQTTTTTRDCERRLTEMLKQLRAIAKHTSGLERDVNQRREEVYDEHDDHGEPA